MEYNSSIATHSVYVHWPFCPYRCHYCPFVALAGQDQHMHEYHRALVAEIEHFGKQAGKRDQLQTLFFGGGTPSTYPSELLLDTFGILSKVFDFQETIEVTIEVNPGTLTKEKLAVWKQAGINRLSVGVQSLKDGVLHELNRMQRVQDVYTLLDIAPEYVSNISVDLILGLPSVTQEEWKKYLQEIVTWPIKHISIYFLTVHEDTQLYFKIQKEQIKLPPEEQVVSLYYWTRDILMKHGFFQYELSNFAKPGYESRHNSVYWDRKPYKAFGLGGCSFDGTHRLQNEKNLLKYMQKVHAQESITVFNETLTEKQIYLEKIMLNLRRSKGVLWQELNAELSELQQLELQQRVAVLKQEGLLHDDGQRLILTVNGLVVENQIITQLLF